MEAVASTHICSDHGSDLVMAMRRTLKKLTEVSTRRSVSSLYTAYGRMEANTTNTPEKKNAALLKYLL